MAKVKRNIGLEILDGIREIKSGDHGRVISVPAVVKAREAEEKARIRVLRDAARLGVDDVEERFRSLDLHEALELHLRSITTKAIAASKRPK